MLYIPVKKDLLNFLPDAFLSAEDVRSSVVAFNNLKGSILTIGSMETKTETKVITVQTVIKAPVKKVWRLWSEPDHIINWCTATDEWHTPKAENDLKVGGRFLTRMEAKDGSSGFDFTGKYEKVELYKEIDYVIDDGRKVKITFDEKNNETTVMESFDAENINSPYTAIKEKKNITTHIDLVNGNIILVNTCHVVAPSTLAASSNSLGNPSIYPFISQILYALPAQSINDKNIKLSIPKGIL